MVPHAVGVQLVPEMLQSTAGIEFPTCAVNCRDADGETVAEAGEMDKLGMGADDELPPPPQAVSPTIAAKRIRDKNLVVIAYPLFLWFRY